MPGTYKAPIPGQGLTAPLGNAAMQHPPKYTKPEEAMRWLFKQITSGPEAQHVLAMMHADVPAEAIARTVLFTAVHKGFITPDMMYKLAHPTIQALVAFAHRSGKDTVAVRMPKHSDGKGQKDTAKGIAAFQKARKDATKAPKGKDRLPPVPISPDHAIPGPIVNPSKKGAPVPPPPPASTFKPDPSKAPTAAPGPAPGGMMSPPMPQVAPGPASAPAPFPQQLG